jgi:hypothetical protein
MSHQCSALFPFFFFFLWYWGIELRARQSLYLSHSISLNTPFCFDYFFTLFVCLFVRESCSVTRCGLKVMILLPQPPE